VEVLRLVAAGATNSRIAEVLSISSRTVDVHMTSILGKTGCANRVIAAAFAQRHGLT
jgi:DNA-binding NarL/FixJ family response regulator